MNKPYLIEFPKLGAPDIGYISVAYLLIYCELKPMVKFKYGAVPEIS